LGGLFSLAANRFSPRGLSLSRDYFPATKPAPSEAHRTSASATATAAATVGVGAPEAESAVDRLRRHGLKSHDDADAKGLFDDPRYGQELIVFVDARDEKAYHAGHVPGAYAFDRYRPEARLPEVVRACQSAEVVVVYCNGGDCEDSEYAAIALRDAGVPGERIGVFLGGIVAWKAKGWPIEVGDRGSGVAEAAKVEP
ncbi:MAG: rhodanese-like domain-containing protein, partial [Verrucomicrobiales bacterium]|nr:rhodanese-like domain-containing protein [Verrucomicrobiales bacterium]